MHKKCPLCECEISWNGQIPDDFRIFGMNIKEIMDSLEIKDRQKEKSLRGILN